MRDSGAYCGLGCQSCWSDDRDAGLDTAAVQGQDAARCCRCGGGASAEGPISPRKLGVELWTTRSPRRPVAPNRWLGRRRRFATCRSFAPHIVTRHRPQVTEATRESGTAVTRAATRGSKRPSHCTTSGAVMRPRQVSDRCFHGLTQEPPVALRFVSFIQVVCSDASTAGGLLVSTLLFIESTLIVTQRDEPRPGPLVTNTRITLANGRRVILRPIAPDDKEQLVAAFNRLGPDSRYRRFFQPMREVAGSRVEVRRRPPGAQLWDRAG